jgi:hypothetical protein
MYGIANRSTSEVTLMNSRWSPVGFLVILAAWLGFVSAEQPDDPLASASFEYNVMSLAEMFVDSPNAEKAKRKIASIAVRMGNAARRTDMDVADYEEALNRLAREGWELVTVNKSNYWVFRRPTRTGR